MSIVSKVNVGVTLHMRNGHQSIWENGAFQNVVFLVQVLQRSPLVNEVVIVIDRDELPAIPEDMMLSDLGIKILTLKEAFHTLNVVIELSATLSEEWLLQFRARGGKNIWMRVGNDYVIDIERAMFNLSPGSLCSRKKVDAVWTIPEYFHSCHDYFSLTARAPVKILPHLWTPLFFDKGISKLPAGQSFGYTPGRERWRLAIAEPNVCMVKTSLVPLLIAEAFYRKNPAKVEVVRVMNAQKLRQHPPFVMLAQMLDLVRHEAASFDDRIPLYELLANQADAVISHHWENGQNYLYYEALYGGYPLIHNSRFIQECGYFYPDFDNEAGADILKHAIQQHDENLPTYRAHANALLKKLDVSHELNVRAYTAALEETLNAPR